MKGLDTNVLVRFLVEETPAQTARIRRRLEAEIDRGEQLFVSTVVLCELVWVLSRVYEVGKPEIAQLLLRLLGTEGVVFSDRDAVEKALARWHEGRGDFADYVIETDGTTAGCSSTLTFDRALLRERGFEAV